ncbi:MAG TPA: nucleotidyltransferase domain-containing protein [Candidatus Nanoarchaeia archaeon]|nr:nucleotidyltransferase domain-containing protein [Candidatus Nanoarchaeia archaeon]
MLTKKQIKIFNLLQKNVFKEYTYKEIKGLSKEKSNSVIQNAVMAFLKEELIIEKTIGTSKLYSINYKNEKFYLYFEIFNKEILPKQAIKTINELKNTLDKHTLFYSIIIFGSYAIGEQKKDSDLDIVVFIEEENKRKIIEAVFKSMELKSFLKIEGHAITKKEFLEMLTVDYENLGKEIARKNLAIHNSAIFYSLLKEGIKHGFKL